MTGERRKLVDDIFLDAVEMPPGKRKAFLEAACPDEEIAREVSSLLRYDDADRTTLASVVNRAAASLVSGDPLVGTRLGPYRITEELGKGGMGAVFLAVRDDQTFEKTVAVKVVKRGMDTDAVLDRFRHERRILANFDHPYISRLLDAGTTPDGRPYFVMEYVEGEPIVAYCRNRSLPLTAILELFRKVCDAVSCAHRNLVVHRDLKAGNILVASDGCPKLLDFGIAKLLDPHNRTEDTAPASRMLTLDCASPEQIRGETVTTATDIYSLGILLFELVAGRPPFQIRSLSTAEAERVICSEPAPKPSAISRETHRRETARWRALTGDLDNIVLLALRKDPARRYRSVDEFSRDILHHLTGHPVIARQDSLAYSSAKFLRRHWLACSFSTVAVLALMTGLVYANVQRRRAEFRLTQILEMANHSLLEVQTEIQHQPGSTESRLRMMQSTLAYLGGLAADTGNNRDVRRTLAKAYLRTGDLQGFPKLPNLGDTAGALRSYEKAEKLLSADEHVALADLFYHRGEVLCTLGRVPDGIAALKKSIVEAAKTNDRKGLVFAADSYHSIAFVLTQTNAGEAFENSRHEMEIYTKLAELEPDNVEVLNGLASSYSTTGGALNRWNRLEESLALFRKGLAIRERLLAGHPKDVMVRRDLMISYGRVGDTLGNPARRSLGDRKGALVYFRKAREIAEDLAAADPENSLARMDLGEILWRVGATMDSPEETLASLAILDAARQTTLSAQNGKTPTTNQHRALAIIDEHRGRRLATLGDLAGSIAAFERSLEQARILARKIPDDASAWSQILLDDGGIAPVLASAGKRDAALGYAAHAVEDSTNFARNGPDRLSMAIYVPRSYLWMGVTYEALAKKDSVRAESVRNWRAAGQAYSQAAAAWRKLSGRDDIFRYRSEIADCARRIAECAHHSAL